MVRSWPTRYILSISGLALTNQDAPSQDKRYKFLLLPLHPKTSRPEHPPSSRSYGYFRLYIHHINITLEVRWNLSLFLSLSPTHMTQNRVTNIDSFNHQRVVPRPDPGELLTGCILFQVRTIISHLHFHFQDLHRDSKNLRLNSTHVSTFIHMVRAFSFISRLGNFKTILGTRTNRRIR